MRSGNLKLHPMVLAALLLATPIAAAEKITAHAAEDATAAAQYKASPVSTDPKAIAAGAYTLDPHHTSVTAKLAHMGLSRYTLRFDAVTGRFAFDPAQATASGLAIAIDPNSIDTGDPAFDRKIASKYFQTDTYPSIVFEAGTVKVIGDRMLVHGTLNFHGVKKPVAMNVTYRGSSGARMGFSGEATFKRSEFGVGEWIPLEADEVTILVETEFVKA